MPDFPSREANRTLKLPSKLDLSWNRWNIGKSLYGSNYAYRTRDSLRTFINQEFGASYVVAWLLVNQFETPVVSCADTEPNDEINWHEAYRESGEERLWFSLWWQDAQ